MRRQNTNDDFYDGYMTQFLSDTFTWQTARLFRKVIEDFEMLAAELYQNANLQQTFEESYENISSDSKSKEVQPIFFEDVSGSLNILNGGLNSSNRVNKLENENDEIQEVKLEEPYYQIQEEFAEKSEQKKEFQMSFRGPYKSYKMKEKQRVLNLVGQGMKKVEVSKLLGIPLKNITRWCKTGIKRKPGAGRKILDGHMEQLLMDWICENFEEGETLRGVQIRVMARYFSENQEFKSSKGWFKNFAHRFSLGQKYEII